MLHQRDVLVAATESRKTPAHFDDELTKLYGSAFTILSADPAIDPAGKLQKSRRRWEPSSTATTQKTKSQTEQRAVDTALREVLRSVHALQLSQKKGWLTLVDGITAHDTWHHVANQVQAASGGHDEASGYFWASMLAATMSALRRSTQSLTATDILDYQRGTALVFDQSRYPRGRAGNSVKLINEMRNTKAKHVAANVIASALAESSLAKRELMTVISVTGSVVSADLWRHPCGVYYLLLPALRLLRRDHGATFSLDTTSRPTEKIIDEELGEEWRLRGVW